MTTIVGDVTDLQQCHHLYKIYLTLSEDQRRSNKGKIVSKCCNISKTWGRGSTPPPPLYHGGGMNLRVRPRVKIGVFAAVAVVDAKAP